MRSLIRSKSAGVTGGRGTAGAGPGRDLLHHASHRGAAGVTEVCVHKGWACRPGLRLSADGELPSIAQRQCLDPVACAVRQHPRGHRFGRGLRVCGWPLCPAPRGPVTWERRVRWDGGPGCGAAPFLIAGGSLRSGKCGPRPGDVGRGRWGRICVRHRGLLRLASTPWVSVVRAGQVDTVPAGVSGRQVVP